MTSSPAPTAFASSVVLPEAVARDAMVAWYRGEFAAANAIIDALCNHLMQIANPDKMPEYRFVFAAIHRRRLNWIPVLHMQRYYSIAEITLELHRLSSKRDTGKKNCRQQETSSFEYAIGKEASSNSKAGGEDSIHGGGSTDPKTEIAEGSPDEKGTKSFNTDDDEQSSNSFKMTKGFVAKEPMRGQMVNVVKGLKLFEDVFTQSELAKLTKLINDLRLGGQRGELSGNTYMLFNKQSKQNNREIIQLGTPIFGPRKDTRAGYIEPIPSLLEAAINQLVHNRIIPEKRKPNGCIINFFDEGQYSQPYTKPPHLDQPVSTLLLSDFKMVFGRVLTTDDKGNIRGSLTLSLKEGSLLVMRGNSADLARHVICATPNSRVCIILFKVRTPDTVQIHPDTISPLTRAMPIRQMRQQQPCKLSVGTISSVSMDPKWRPTSTPFPLVPSGPRTVISHMRRTSRAGTGVFLPWTSGSKRSPRFLPPRIRRAKLLSFAHSFMDARGEAMS